MSDVTTITINRNGSLKVEGPVRIVDSAGKEIANLKPAVFLCRCGLSANKPFCDGSHKAGGFQGAEAHIIAAEAAASTNQ